MRFAGRIEVGSASGRVLGRLLVVPPLALVAVACLLCCGGCGSGDASESLPRADLVAIAVAGADGERPAVSFPHDLHTEAVIADGGDCSTCHQTREDGYLSNLYMRLDDAVAGDGGEVEVDGLMEIYHDNCLACHTRMAGEGKDSGPVTCGECHREEAAYVSSRIAMGMDKSLHYRHSVARNDKCEDCHHLYDETSQKLYHEKNTESSCRDCHRTLTEENRSSIKLASHRACLKCHMETAKEGPNVASGPQSCGGCHDPHARSDIKVVEDVPRLKRGQPDFVLLSAPEADIELSKLKTVPFSHDGHETFAQNCRVCHHETMKSCSECHTLAGKDEGAGVMLQTAMHGMVSNHSCVGCHEIQKSDAECAGCHDLMQKGRLSEHACHICHAGPSPADVEAARTVNMSLEHFRPDPSQLGRGFAATDVPDSVVISVLSDEYEPAVMPHRKIVEKLRGLVKENKMATHFHGSEDVLCQGCHHNGSIGERPALCENCHGRPFMVDGSNKPGLYGAYHRQCLGCHQSMGMENPSDCQGCHAKKISAAE
jgi:hypothetical protein